MKQKEFYDLARDMEEACGDWENSEGLSEETLKSLIAKVEAMDAKEQASKVTVFEKSEPLKKRRHLKKRYLFVLAAALILLMGVGVVGDRAWIADSRDLERESEVTTKINNEEKASVLLEEEDIYREIAEKLGIAPMRLGYMPEGMVLDSYSILENAGWAYLFYLYNGQLISVQMSKRMEESSSNVQWDGEYQIIDDFENAYGLEESMEVYCVDEEHLNYGANVLYGNGYYNIFCVFDDANDFLKLIKYIYF